MFKFIIILDSGVDRQFNKAIAKDWRGWLNMHIDVFRLSVNRCVAAAVWISKFGIILNCKCLTHASVYIGETLNYVKSYKLSKNRNFSDSKTCLQSILTNQLLGKTKYHLV